MTDTIDELLVVADLLDEAKKYGLEAEVVYFALKYMKENSELSIIEAITYGYDEWVTIKILKYGIDADR